VGQATRNLVEKLYGITTEHQIQIEKYFNAKNDYLEIDCPLLDSYMPDKFRKFYDLYTEEVDVTDMDEIKYTVKNYPYDAKFDLYDDDPNMWVNDHQLKNDPETKDWYQQAMDIKMDKKRDLKISEKEHDNSFDDDSDFEEIGAIEQQNGFGEDGGYPVPKSESEQERCIIIEEESDLNYGYTESWNQNDFGQEDSYLEDFKYRLTNSYNYKQAGKLVDRLWTKVKVFGKKLRPGGCSLIMVFYETPAENKDILQGAEMQRNNRTMNSKRGKLSNRRNVNRNNVNLPKRKIKKQIRPRGNRAINYSRAPAALGTQLRTKDAKFFRSTDGSIRVVHREPLGTQLGYTNFTVASFAANPGLTATFPWLSKIAQNFETYKFNKLNVEFITSVGSNIGGSICIAPDYNSADGSPANIQQMEQYMDAWRDVCWENGVCRISPKGMGALGPMRYMRGAPLASNLDIKTYDVCNIFVGTSGVVANASQIGEIWVSYDVDLCIPNAFIADVQEPDNAFGYVYSSAGTGISTTSAFGTASTAVGPLVITGVGNLITVVGATIGDKYEIIYSGDATTVSAAIETSSTLVGCSANYVSQLFISNTGATSRMNVTATASTFSLTLQYTGTWATVTNMYFSVLLDKASI